MREPPHYSVDDRVCEEFLEPNVWAIGLLPTGPRKVGLILTALDGAVPRFRIFVDGHSSLPIVSSLVPTNLLR